MVNVRLQSWHTTWYKSIALKASQEWIAKVIITGGGSHWHQSSTGTLGARQLQYVQGLSVKRFLCPPKDLSNRAEYIVCLFYQQTSRAMWLDFLFLLSKLCSTSKPDKWVVNSFTPQSFLGFCRIISNHLYVITFGCLSFLSWKRVILERS